MEGLYLEIRFVHIASVVASGLVFLTRAFALNGLSASWPMSSPVRRLSYLIDTILLAAALMLTIIVRQYPFVDGWLTVKVLVLIVYIVLGWYAFRAPRGGQRLAFTAAAVAVYLFI